MIHNREDKTILQATSQHSTIFLPFCCLIILSGSPLELSSGWATVCIYAAVKWGVMNMKTQQ